MSTQELVSLGHVSQRCNVTPQLLLGALLGQGHQAKVSLNGMLFFEAEVAYRIAEQIKSGAPLPPAKIIHGEPCGPVEFHDANDGDDNHDDGEPPLGDIPPGPNRMGSLHELTGGKN